MKRYKELKISIICVLAVIIVLTFILAGKSTRAGSTESESITAEEEQTETVADDTSPVISGIEEITVHVGDAVAYRSGVTVTDDTDPDPQLTVDNSEVDLNTEGRYRVYYTAVDSSGNETTVVTYVNVVSRETVTAGDAEMLADEILADIISDEMSDVEKLEAVYDYMHGSGYIDVDYADVDDYLTNAYYFLTTRRGDCKCFYAASKLLLERLGFTAMRIQNRSGVLVHYWNLVSTDGGETWYHFDPTDWEWTDPEEPFMMTDAEIRAYSARHSNIPYDWNEEDYPATPEESFEG